MKNMTQIVKKRILKNNDIFFHCDYDYGVVETTSTLKVTILNIKMIIC